MSNLPAGDVNSNLNMNAVNNETPVEPEKIDQDTEQGYNIAVQQMVEIYLRDNNRQSMAEFLAEQNIVDEPGVIYNYHFMVLQEMLNNELAAFGYDLKTLVEKTGAQYVEGELSPVEQNIISDRISLAVGLIGYGMEVGEATAFDDIDNEDIINMLGE